MDGGAEVKQEVIEHLKHPEANQNPTHPPKPISVIDLSTSDSDSSSSSSSCSSSSSSSSSSSLPSDDDDSVVGINGKRSRVSSSAEPVLSKKKKKKKKTADELGVALPVGFLDPLPPKNVAVSRPHSTSVFNANASANVVSSKQFWKAGDFEGETHAGWDTSSGGMDHVRVHPKFLHSNATSHKWVLGAFAELLDNSLDEVCNGATFVNVDMLKSKKDGGKMLRIEDNGGGMDQDKMRQCMSLGYSVKNKVANTIGQYGNGFKTSTMRLGADAIVFSRCCGKDGKRPTQSIGLLSYTFLMSTGKEDIVVPMLDYERGGQEWNRMKRSSVSDWNRNLETIVQWSPFLSEVDLLQQFSQMEDHGTRIIIYNLWEDDQGQLELDFDADPHDIQIRGVNRDEKNIQMAKQFPNSKHFLTYRHSLRSYASILYLRIPSSFRIILRGKDVEHHDVVNDMMMAQEITYRPQPGTDGVPKDSNMVAVVTIGFVKDAKAHIDVQGFNVYHKNRLIKPFWRLWNATGSDGRGVIGVLEANFVEPAHDKQGFERTTVLSRLEGRLIQMQKTYWRTYCHKIGYAPRRNKKHINEGGYLPQTSPRSKKKKLGSSSKIPVSGSDKLHSPLNPKQGRNESERYTKLMDEALGNERMYNKGGNRANNPVKSGKEPNSSEPSTPSEENVSDDEMQTAPPERKANGNSQKVLPANRSFGKDGSHVTRSSMNLGNVNAEQDCASHGRPVRITCSQSKGGAVSGNECSLSISNSNTAVQLKEENQQLRERLKRKDGEILGDLLHDIQFERDGCKSLETKLEEATQKIEELNKEQESLIDIFSEERERRDIEEEKLRKQLKDASNTIQQLLDKVRMLEKMKSPSSKLVR